MRVRRIRIRIRIRMRIRYSVPTSEGEDSPWRASESSWV